jgi:hypothetical protein
MISRKLLIRELRSVQFAVHLVKPKLLEVIENI